MASKVSGVIDNDKGFKNLLKTNKLLRDSSAAVGILSDAPSEGKMNMARLGAIHEFGVTIPVTQKMKGWFLYNFGVALKKAVITIPARPFMAMTFDRIREKIFQKMKDSLVRLQDAGTQKKEINEAVVRRELGLLGEYAVTEVKKTFETGDFKPLSDLTIESRKKGKGTQSPKPLLDTGRLRASINQRVDLNKKGDGSFKTEVIE